MSDKTPVTPRQKMEKVMAYDELIETAEGILLDSVDHKVIKRFVPVDQYNEPKEGVELYRAIYLDTETTGLDHKVDKVIEIGMVPFDYDQHGNIYRVYEAYNGLEDPGIPIPEEITKITHITDEDVAGQKFDEEKIRQMVSEARIIIAHNSKFDRGFCEERFPFFLDENWACSMQEIDWRDEDVESAKLEFIAYKKGFFYEGHRAEIDCRAGLHVLSMNSKEGAPYLKVMLDKARKPSYKVWAINAPFAKKDDLKKRKYQWNGGEDGNPKAWSIEVDEDSLQEEKDWLNNEVYGYNYLKLRVDKVTAQTRYSPRIILEEAPKSGVRRNSRLTA